jgi:hypothetical protein
MSPVKADLYDQQQQETKETIELLFSHSSKLLAYPVITFANKNPPTTKVFVTNESTNNDEIPTCSTNVNSSQLATNNPNLNRVHEFDIHKNKNSKYDSDLKYTLV